MAGQEVGGAGREFEHFPSEPSWGGRGAWETGEAVAARTVNTNDKVVRQLNRFDEPERQLDRELVQATSANNVSRRGEGFAERDRPVNQEAEAVSEHSNTTSLRDPLQVPRIHVVVLQQHANDPDKLAREAIDDIVHHHPDAVVAKLERLAGAGKELSPMVRTQLLSSVARESESVARQLEIVMNDGMPLNGGGTSVKVERGHIFLVRDIEHLPRTSQPVLTNDRPVVYVDERIRIAREGMSLDPGDQVAFWMHQRAVKIETLRAGDIGTLPDRLVDASSGLTAERTSGQLPDPAARLSNLVYLIRQCDATPDTTNNCNGR